MFNFKNTEPRNVWWLWRILLTVLCAYLFFNCYSIPPNPNVNPDTVTMTWMLMTPLIVGIVANNCRRLRDAKLSQWWTLIEVVPVIGTIGIFVICGCWPSR